MIIALGIGHHGGGERRKGHCGVIARYPAHVCRVPFNALKPGHVYADEDGLTLTVVHVTNDTVWSAGDGAICPRSLDANEGVMVHIVGRAVVDVGTVEYIERRAYKYAVGE